MRPKVFHNDSLTWVGHNAGCGLKAHADHVGAVEDSSNVRRVDVCCVG